MTADAAAQLRRLLSVIPRLTGGRAHSIDEIARLARVDRATVAHDLFALATRVGEPGAFVPGLEMYIEGGAEGGGDVSVRAPHFRRPMGLTAAELAALELGLAMLRRERVPAEQRTIDRARERLRKAVARLPADPVPAAVRHGDLGAVADPVHLATIRQAVRERRTLRITYRAAGAEQSTARVVRPYGLVASRGAWYLVGHCDDREAIRIFRLDRIDDAVLLPATFAIPAEFSLESVVQDGRVFRAEEPQALRVRYSPAVAPWIAERERVPVAADGSVTVEHPLADVQWAVRHVLQYGPEAEVLAPEAARLAIAERLRRIVSRSPLRPSS